MLTELSSVQVDNFLKNLSKEYPRYSFSRNDNYELSIRLSVLGGIEYEILDKVVAMAQSNRLEVFQDGTEDGLDVFTLTLRDVRVSLHNSETLDSTTESLPKVRWISPVVLNTYLDKLRNKYPTTKIVRDSSQERVGVLVYPNPSIPGYPVNIHDDLRELGRFSIGYPVNSNLPYCFSFDNLFLITTKKRGG